MTIKQIKDLEAMNKRLSKDNLNLAKEIDRLNIKKIKDSCSPNGWPADQIIEPIKKVTEAEAAASFGLSREDFTDTGEDLQELIELTEGN